MRPLDADLLAKLPRYKSHKIVRAAAIQAIEPERPGEPMPAHIIVREGDLDTSPLVYIPVPDDFLQRHPAMSQGDYLVIYDEPGGRGHYLSVSPRRPFVDGYQRLEPTMTLAEADDTRENTGAPRVTVEHLKDLVADARYFVDGLLTICVLELKNGWKEVGVSAAADARNYDADRGARYAYEDAFRKLWPLEGYLLKSRLAERRPTWAEIEEARGEVSGGEVLDAAINAGLPDHLQGVDREDLDPERPTMMQGVEPEVLRAAAALEARNPLSDEAQLGKGASR